MRLLKPSPGECVDRQTILQLKMAAADPGNLSTKVDADKTITDGETTWAVNRTLVKNASTVDITPWQYEHEAIQQYLEKEWFPTRSIDIADSFDLLSDQLFEINQKLWKLEDEARELKGTSQNTARAFRAEVVLFEITMSNDKRAELVRQINQLFGVDVVEKLYAGVAQ